MAALITGGAKRLGRAMALHLASKGHDVVIHYSSSATAAEETAAAARAFGVKAAIVHADLLDTEDTGTLIARAIEAIEEPLDVLINNASIFEYDNLGTASFESWDRHINSNLRAPVFLTQAFANQVPKAAKDDHGEAVASACVINMVDMRVRKLTPEFATYTLAKAGLWAFTQTAAQFLAPHVRVNAIGPGPTMQGTRQSAEHFAKQRAATILERGSDPSEICKALDFILEIDGMTGQLICLDGGQHLAWKTPDVLGVE
ncbi:MAG: short chain dehydrogenase [Desulfuromonadales bacterium C00003068]|jgi:NAD(P)-dependent dehydrogenase (short-subunit alcohol dehydrogenase family)|nr:MAG: short chain dehydrogenase [Desulfuromonadales bacterium C00003068]